MLLMYALAAAVALTPPCVPAGPPCLVVRQAPEGASLVRQAATLREALALMADWVHRHPECRVLVRSGRRVVASHVP